MQKFSESSLIISGFTEEKGIIKFIVRGALSKSRQAEFQLGNLISGTLKAKSEDSLGQFSGITIIESFASLYINSKSKNLALKTILELLNLAIKQGEEYKNLYQDTINLLKYLKTNNLTPEIYIEYELKFLRDIGYGIDISKCAVTGEKQELFYISPNTGHAVTLNAGEKYKNKLFKIPNFLKDKDFIPEDLENSFKITNHFLNKHLFQQTEKAAPFSRELLKSEFRK